MNIHVCGLNYKTAPLSIREDISRAFNQSFSPDEILKYDPDIQEIVFLNTCNRTEIYCVTEKTMDIKLWLGQRLDLPPSILDQHVYGYMNETAIEHILKVGSGLDSLALGEPQIVGQMKEAVFKAREAKTLGETLSKFFEYVFYVIKQVRSRTGLNEKPVSIASIALNVAQQIFSDFSSLQGVFVGVSLMTRLAMKHFYEQGMRKMWVVNRTLEHAQSLAKEFHAQAAPFSELTEILSKAHIVVSATSAPHTVIHKNMLQPSSSTRLAHPLLLLDLAVPRDIDSDIEKLDVFLYSIDDLQQVARQHLASRQSKAVLASTMIRMYTQDYIKKMDEGKASPVISHWREHYQSLAQQELLHATQKLKAGMNPQEVMQRLTHRLTQKFLHTPSMLLKKLGYANEQEKMNVLQELLHLNQNLNPNLNQS